MTRYKLTIEYKGTNFIGWQKQKEGYSIQGTIEKAAKNFLQKEICKTIMVKYLKVSFYLMLKI